MAFTNIPNGNLQVGAPLRSVDILALRDNIPAVMNGDTGAPRIKAAAFEGQSGAAPVFAARAWVNFNGTGTVEMLASGNVSSVTDLGVGNYRVNFTTAMPDANLSMSGTASSVAENTGLATLVANTPTPFTTTSARIAVFSGISNTDRAVVSIAIFR